MSIASAATWLRSGGIVAFPTDTFYGLAVDPMLPAAVEALFDLKGRDARAAVPLIAASLEDLVRIVGSLDRRSDALARAFWPGPLSLIVAAPTAIAPAVHGGAGTLAVRVPAHPLACALAEAAGGLITATSANRSGQPAVSSAADLGELASDPRVFVLDGGITPGGVASTIVDARGTPPVLVREGAIAWDRVLRSLGE